MQDDYTDAVYHLINKGIIDTARIGIYGMSFGGYFALNGVIRDSGLYKCAASCSGYTNLFSYLKEVPPYDHQYLEMMYEMIGNPEKDVEYLKECSPAFHTDKIRVPLFIAHGENDHRMSVDEINQFVKNIKNQNIKVNYLLIPDEAHGFRKEENKITLYTELEMFFEENLMNRK
jgi:dipeptidyl aminopeptidase/acylaminoacyl peptidase